MCAAALIAACSTQPRRQCLRLRRQEHLRGRRRRCRASRRLPLHRVDRGAVVAARAAARLPRPCALGAICSATRRYRANAAAGERSTTGADVFVTPIFTYSMCRIAEFRAGAGRAAPRAARHPQRRGADRDRSRRRHRRVRSGRGCRLRREVDLRRAFDARIASSAARRCSTTRRWVRARNGLSALTRRAGARASRRGGRPLAALHGERLIAASRCAARCFLTSSCSAGRGRRHYGAQPAP